MQREQVSEKFRVRLGHGLLRKLVSCEVFGDTRIKGENIGRSAPFHFSIMNNKSLLLVFLCIFSFNAIYADITWNLSEEGTLTISGTDMPVYDYGETPWFSKQNIIKEVIIESGVTNIGDYAFSGCNKLSSVTIPASVTWIGEEAFSGCSCLISVSIPNSVKRIGEYAFANCSSLTSVTIPNTLTNICDYTFNGCI